MEQELALDILAYDWLTSYRISTIPEPFHETVSISRGAAAGCLVNTGVPATRTTGLITR
jgi:hypothetical protein